MPVLFIQSDHSILLDADHPDAEAARFSIARFAELVKTPGPLHYYRVTPLSLWNAAAAGASAQDILDALGDFAAHEVPAPMRTLIETQLSNYGRLWIEDAGDWLALCSHDPTLLDQLNEDPTIAPMLRMRLGETRWLFEPSQRGALKQALMQLKLPADDRASYHKGALLSLALNGTVTLRDYQREAVQRLAQGGSGVVVLPCGAGKTLVGIGLIARQQTNTLILAPGITAARQWANELERKTTLSAEQIGEYSGECKQIRPVTVATYQMLTHALQAVQTEVGRQRSIFALNDWGLIIYDEVHLLPAPVFRLAANIQTTRRLGLTATLVREDHREGDVFALIGPTRYQAGWKALERAGWIAEALCNEVRIAMDDDERLAYLQARKHERARLAGENAGKLSAAQQIIARHRGDQILVIGQYLAQLQQFADALHTPFIHGDMHYDERNALYEQFRRGEVKLLVVSKVANYAVDLPDANVAIQVSGTFGSRQEEAQRLGRILRPKANGAQAHFYSLVTQDTVEQDYAAKRQRFLVEQGYEYKIVTNVE
ncbi:MAG: DEAD/DEAH box helicase [Chloroflexi bacterium]|nr:DEAD/DEAH box helicase [Chloroflexota bacterium]